MGYDLVLKWRPGTLHKIPDALSRLPLEDINRPEDIQNNFPDDVSTKPPTYMGPKGPIYSGELLNERYPADVGDEDSNAKVPIAALLIDSAEIKAKVLAKSRFNNNEFTPPDAKNYPLAELAAINFTSFSFYFVLY